MKTAIIITLMMLFTNYGNAQNFKAPIEGEYGKDFIIVNYIDWGTNQITDFHKGTKTYAGHRGTDFTLSGFPQMDKGVFVNAVDTGVVTFIHDGEYDRNTEGNTNLGLGNYIAIKHPNKLYSYYGHLKKNSLLVKTGDKVSPGQHIASVGSSGNSTDPHLHFELWYDSLYLVEPFAASCGADNSFWEQSIPYDTAFHVWESGLTDFIPSINNLKNRPIEKVKFNEQDSIIAFWTLQYGIKEGDSTKIEWLTPNGSLWFEYSYTYKKDWWYYYFYSYIFAPSSDIWGKWKYNYYYNDKLVLSGDFEVEKPSGISDTKTSSYYRIIDDENIEVFLPQNIVSKTVKVYNISGQEIIYKDISSQNSFALNIPNSKNNPEVFLVSIKHKNGYWNFKLVL